MSQIAISASGLSKRFQAKGRQERYRLLGDTLADVARAPMRMLRGGRRGNVAAADADFWALDDVSFEVKRGEVVGVIGHNGAGKSTLLKVLSRITEPTAGLVELRGRVGALLEVGTGFHVELTGRENVFLNGAFLGMKRAEIERHFDEIVAFAEVERFVDTPVKHYSSGMQLRLAFSVAAHLQPEILLLDEVLAVGDASFQRKCLGKMEDVAAGGRTVMFVSHNLGAVKELCDTAIVLHKGRLVFRGPVTEGIGHYTRTALASTEMESEASGWTRLRAAGSAEAASWRFTPGDAITLSAELHLPTDCAGGHAYCILNDSSGGLAVHQRVDLRDLGHDALAQGRYDVRVALPPLWLAPGMYSLHFKFIGRAVGGEDLRYTSERPLLDVVGWSNDRGRAYLAPPAAWTLSAAGATLGP